MSFAWLQAANIASAKQFLFDGRFARAGAYSLGPLVRRECEFWIF